MTIAGKKHKVLMVSFHFPPINTPGAVRVGKLAKYLPEFGWEVVVLTADVGVDSSHNLPVEIREEKIVRTQCPNFRSIISRWHNKHLPAASFKASSNNKTTYQSFKLFRPLTSTLNRLPLFTMLNGGEPLGWYLYAVKEGLKIIREENIDVIFSSANPLMPHFVASRLHKKTKIPWVAEFRDIRFTYTRTSKLAKKLDRNIEKAVLKGNSVLVGISESMTQLLELRHSNKGVTITNGFDEDDYFEKIPLITSKFTLTYTGGIYLGRRDPGQLFEAIALLKREDKISPDNFEVRFFGGSSLQTLYPLIVKYDISTLVKIYAPVAFRESIKKQKESTALLLLNWNDPRDEGTFTSKFFDYLGARRPILASAFKGGVVDKLLQEAGCGIVVNETNEIRVVLLKWINEFRKGGEITSYYHVNENVIMKYTRKEQAKNLAEVFDKLL